MLHKVLSGTEIPNGGSWSLDNKTFYFVNSPSKNIYAYDFDEEAGTLSNKRVFFKLDLPEGGDPDGHAIDAEGYIWQAVWGASKVLRISPAGELVATIELPTRHITCVRFVGEDLYITSAADTESGDAVSEKYGGSIFKVNVGVKGREVYNFGYEGR